jgi:sugar phosphate isomerase/epimerase
MITGLLLHSVSYSGSWGQTALSLEDFIDHAAALGFGGVMLMAKRPHLSVLDYDDDACFRLRDRLQQRDVGNVVVAGYTNLTAGFHYGEVPQAEFQIAYIVRLARMAALLGGTLVRVFTGYECEGVPFDRQWRTVADTLRESASRTAEYGVTLGVQNHHDLAVETTGMQELLATIDHPNCRAMFDAWAPAMHGEDPAEAARRLAPATVHTTVANYRHRDRYRYLPALVNYERLTPRMQAVPMDEGFIDYAAFFRAIDEAGFRGSVAYEMCSPLRDGGSQSVLDRYAAAFLEFMHIRVGVVRERHQAV